MSAIQLYSNGNNYYYIFISISSLTIITLVIFEIYFYFNEYTQNINLKFDNISKKLLAQSGMLLSQSETIEKKNKQISELEQNIHLLTTKLNILQENVSSLTELSKKYDGMQNKIENIDTYLNDVSEHSHINMDKIFTLENNIVNINNKYSELKTQLSCNDKDIYHIDRRLTLMEKNFTQMIPDYVLIGLKSGTTTSSPIPIFVPNDFTFTEENMNIYGIHHIDLIVSNFKYLKNIKEIVLDNFKESKTHFNKILLSIYNGKNRDAYNQNTIITISPENFIPYTNFTQNPNYILNIQDANNRTYYKKGLRNLRSELSKLDIKLILNEEFEEFIR